MSSSRYITNTLSTTTDSLLIDNPLSSAPNTSPQVQKYCLYPTCSDKLFQISMSRNITLYSLNPRYTDISIYPEFIITLNCTGLCNVLCFVHTELYSQNLLSPPSCHSVLPPINITLCKSAFRPISSPQVTATPVYLCKFNFNKLQLALFSVCLLVFVTP